MQLLFRRFSFSLRGLIVRRVPLRLLVLSLLSCLALLTPSCIEGEEELWINLDKSGRLEARYEFPSLALKQIGDPEKIVEALKQVAAREKGLTLTLCTATTEGTKTSLHLKGEFDDVLELFELAARNEELFVAQAEVDPDKIEAVAGDIDFRFTNLRGVFTREIDLNHLFPELVSKRPGMLGSSTFKYTLHLPVPVKATDAHTVSPDGKSVSWTFLLREHFGHPMKMSLKTKLPWWLWLVFAAAGLLLLTLILLVWRLIRRLRRGRSSFPDDSSAAHQMDLPAS